MTIALHLDTETTGIDEPQAIQVAFYGFVGFQHPAPQPDEIFNEYYMPSKPISFGAKAVHHIFEDDLDGCEPSGSFELPGGTEYLVGHNIDFDWKVLGSPPVKRICTLAMSRHLYPDADSHSLSAMVYMLFGKMMKKNVQAAHNALADINLSLQVFDQLLFKAKEMGHTFESWEDVWRFSEQARIPTKMPFGKHKGKAIAEVDRGYASWYAKQDDVDEYLLEAFRQAGKL